MKKKLSLLITLVLLTIGCIVLIIIREFSDSSKIIVAIITFILMLIPQVFFYFIDKIQLGYEWEQGLDKLIKTGKITKNTFIRISYAYLYKIKVDEKYLLIRATRFTNEDKYQPLGGVYKYYDDFKKKYFDKLGVVYDDHVVDESTKNDFRLKVPAKNLRKFYRAFTKAIALRENSKYILREFNDEFIDKANFTKEQIESLLRIETIYDGRHIQDIEYSTYFQIYEMLLCDIFIFNLTKEQLDLIIKETKANDNYLLATQDEIKTLGYKKENKNFGSNILPHAKKIIDDNRADLIQVKNQ